MEAPGSFLIEYGKDMAIVRTRMQWVILALLVALLLGLPHLLVRTNSISWLIFSNFTMMTIIGVLGLNITTGMAGQVSMGQAAFMMLGGYAAGLLTVKAGWPFWAALPIGSLITGAIGILVGLPSLRLKGFYLAVATFAFAFVAQYIVFQTPGLTGGAYGLTKLPRPSIGGLIFDTDVEWFYLILVFTVAAIYVSARLARSRIGRAFYSVRDNEIAAAGQGVDVYPTKLRAFFVGTVFAGVAGGLWAHYLTIMSAETFTFFDSIWFLGMIFIGGAGSTMGAVMGVTVLELVGYGTATVSRPLANLSPAFGAGFSGAVTHVVFGLLIVLFLVFLPKGLVSGWNSFKEYYRRWPFSYQ